MKYVLSLILILSYAISFSQKSTERSYSRFSLTAQAGFSRMTSLPKNIDEQLSFGTGIQLHYNIMLSKRKIPFYLTTGIGYERHRFISDGLFVQNDEDYSFVQTPSDFKQHEDDMQFLHFPVLFRFITFRESATSIGLYGNYLLKANNKYKIKSDKFTTEASVENNLQIGLAFDQEFIILRNKESRTAPVVGYGLSYQLSKFLDDQRSFKPLSGYLKFGLALW